MKRYFPLLLLALIITVISIISLNQCKELKRLKANQETLLDTIHNYQINDSLHVASISNLELSLSKYKKYRAEDAKLISQLKGQKPKTATTVATKSEYNINQGLKDSIVYIDNYIDTLKTISYKDKWHTVNGFISNDSIQLNIINYEDLLITESLQKKKFLFFRLPISIFGYKKKQLNVISKNPNTHIISSEYITIK